MIDELVPGNRYGGAARLYGRAGFARIRAARVLVVGIGGVGSWTVEALARSGVGTLGLCDLDDVCVTNTNRQIHAVDGTVGMAKVEAMRARVALIDPTMKVEAIQRFFTKNSSAEILGAGWDVVVDAIDSMNPKCQLIADCLAARIPIVTCGGAGDSFLEPGPRAQALQDKALVIDIREPHERIGAPKHILSMPNVPRAEWATIPELFPQRPLVLCCAGGVRTRMCVEALGHPPGIFAWTRPIHDW